MTMYVNSNLKNTGKSFFELDRSAPIGTRIEGIVVTVAKNSLMNGDPMNGGQQRVDPETGKALTTPVSMNDRIRAVAKLHGRPLYIERGGEPLASKLNALLGSTPEPDPDSQVPVEGEGSRLAPTEEKAAGKKEKKGKAAGKEKKGKEEIQAAIKALCLNFDIPVFGGVLCQPINQGLRGGLHFSFGETIEPVSVVEHQITRGVVTREDNDNERTMGTLPAISFGLFRTNFYINAFDGQSLGATNGDFQDALEYLIQSYDLIRSSLRSNNHFYKMILFRHPTAYGVESSLSILNRVKITRKNPTGEALESLPAASSEDDYEVTINEDGLDAKGIVVEVIDI